MRKWENNDINISATMKNKSEFIYFNYYNNFNCDNNIFAL